MLHALQYLWTHATFLYNTGEVVHFLFFKFYVWYALIMQVSVIRTADQDCQLIEVHSPVWLIWKAVWFLMKSSRFLWVKNNPKPNRIILTNDLNVLWTRLAEIVGMWCVQLIHVVEGAWLDVVLLILVFRRCCVLQFVIKGRGWTVGTVCKETPGWRSCSVQIKLVKKTISSSH